jgi:tol-pal system protein YbgF
MSKTLRLLALLLAALGSTGAHALFNDDEARRAILDLRQRLETLRQETEQRSSEQINRATTALTDENAQLRRSILALQTQIETQRAEMARLVGQNEQLARDVAELQRLQKDVVVGLDERLRKFEPIKVTVDGREFMAEQAEKREYDSALGVFRKGDFAGATTAFAGFIRRYPSSGYVPSAFFWLGNAQYATREYKEAIQNFRNLLTQAPDHLRAPEAVLSIANCQVELKDTKAARSTLEDLIKAYPQSEAAAAAKQRLPRLK